MLAPELMSDDWRTQNVRMVGAQLFKSVPVIAANPIEHRLFQRELGRRSIASCNRCRGVPAAAICCDGWRLRMQPRGQATERVSESSGGGNRREAGAAQPQDVVAAAVIRARH